MAPLTHSRTAPFPSTEQRLGLYPVVDSVEWIERLLKAGVRTIQLRIKDQSENAVETDIAQAIAPVSYTHLDVYKRQHEYPDYR